MRKVGFTKLAQLVTHKHLCSVHSSSHIPCSLAVKVHCLAAQMQQPNVTRSSQSSNVELKAEFMHVICCHTGECATNTVHLQKAN